MIIPASYPSRGFAKLGIASDQLSNVVKKFCENNLSNTYEFELSGNDIWMRSKERRTNTIINYIDIIAEITNATKDDCSWINSIEAKYNHFHSKTIILEDQQLPFNLMQNVDKLSEYEQIYKAGLSLFTVTPTLRQKLLQDTILPWYFNKFPEGAILAIKTNYSYESRLALLRIGNISTIYDVAEISANQHNFEYIKTISDIQQTAIIDPLPYLLSISNLFFPYSGIYVLHGFGYELLLFTNKQPFIERGKYPRSFIDLHKLNSLMNGDEPDMSASGDPKQGWLGRYIPPHYFNSNQLILLFKQAIDKLNRLYCLRLDITNYRSGDQIDFIKAFEEYSTLDRVLIETNICQCATDGYSARLATFSVIDKIAELISFPSIDKGKYFHYMFSKDFRDKYLLPNIKTYPSPFNDYFLSETNRIYDNLYNCILSSDGLWMQHRLSASGIKIRNWDKTSNTFNDSPTPITPDIFVGEIIRAIRNTHHGYISDVDNKRRFAIYASMHTGKLPDDITAIPQLIWLSMLNNPENTILTDWVSDTILKNALI